MNRSTKLLIAQVAIASVFLLGCGNPPQNGNGNVGVRQDTNTNSATPTPDNNALDAACNDSDPTHRATAVQNFIDDKISHDSSLSQEKTAGLFKDKVVMFPKGGITDPEPQALAIIFGGVITGKNLFQKLIPIVQPVMGNKCVQAVAFVPIGSVPLDAKVASLPASGGDNMFIWTACDYPNVACPDGLCAMSCPGGIGKGGGGTSLNTSSMANTAGNGHANTGTSNKPKP